MKSLDAIIPLTLMMYVAGSNQQELQPMDEKVMLITFSLESEKGLQLTL